MSENEKMLFSGAADTLLLNTFRKGTVTLAITTERVIVKRLLTSDEYSWDEITGVERFKAMFMNIGIRFQLNNGKKVALATRHINKVMEVLAELGKSVS
ncbi:MAG: hypothetical protein ACRDBO_04650 [Lachnospiraceae bacterium]